MQTNIIRAVSEQLLRIRCSKVEDGKAVQSDDCTAFCALRHKFLYHSVDSNRAYYSYQFLDFIRLSVYNWWNRKGDLCMDYITAPEAAIKWGISERRIQKLCEDNRIPGVERISYMWLIPKDAGKPADGRQKEFLKGKSELVWLLFWLQKMKKICRILL